MPPFIIKLFALAGVIAISFQAVATPQNAESLDSPDAAVEIMKESGFRVELIGSGGMLFLPNANGTYKLIARLTEAPDSESCEKKEKVNRKTGQIINTIGICMIPDWKAPEGFENNLVNSGMAFTDFWKALSVNGGLPPIGGAETDASYPVRAEIFNISVELNGQLREAEYDVWTSCWDSSLESGSSRSAILPNKRRVCTKAKGELMVLTSKAELQVSEVLLAAAKLRLEESLGLRPKAKTAQTTEEAELEVDLSGNR